jgi:heme-degrading monooxygenase HmoA
MYLTINRFRVHKGQEAAFEALWLNRDSRLTELDGFVSFYLLKGAETDTHTIYLSHTMWRDEAAFQGWARSQAFRSSHKGAGGHGEIYDGPPVLEIYSALQSITA